MQYQKIGYEHCQAVERIRRIWSHQTSSHSFASLYLWQQQMKLSIALEDDCFYVKCGWKGEHAYFFPCGSESRILAFLDRHRNEQGFRLVYLREADKQFLQHHFQDRVKCRYAPDDAEYLYRLDEQLALPGRKYARIRTRLHRFERICTPRIKAIDRSNTADGLAVVRQWAAVRGEQTGGITDTEPACRMLLEREALGIQGLIVYLGGVPSAVAGGYPLADRIFDLSLAKESQPISGLGYFARQQLYRRLAADYDWINAEEDLGIEGVRTFKSGMRPAHMAGMWEGEFR